MRVPLYTLALLCLLAPALLFGFYDKRKPTPEEEKAIAKYTTVMNKVLDQFRSPDWNETVDDTIDHPQINIMDDRPFDIDQQLQRTYHVRTDSKRYQTLIAPRLQKVAQLKDPTQRDMERAQAEDMMHLQVQVHFNLWVVPMITPPDTKKDPKIPGATFVHQDRDNPFNHGVAYILFFSNGRLGKWDETNSVYRNVFIHKPGTPYIENLEIRIYGAEDRIKELLHRIDWKQVNLALTQR
jgi:hypothetical protein